MAQLSELYRRCGATGLIAVSLLSLGGLTCLHALANRGGVTMACDRYLADKPGSKWVKLEGCVLSRIESVAKSTVGKSAAEVYIPVRPATEKGRANTRILLASTAQDDLDFVNHANGPQSQRASRGAFLATFGDKLEETRAIEGRVWKGMDLPDRDRAKVMKTLPTLAPDFVIIEERPRPGFFLPLSLLFAGAVMGGIRAYPLLKGKLRSASHYGAGEMFATK